MQQVSPLFAEKVKLSRRRLSRKEKILPSYEHLMDQHGEQLQRFEWLEMILINKYIPPTATVMEIGARVGASSCCIANTLHNSGRLIVVEGDPLVWQALSDNLRTNNCQARLWMGVLASKPAKKNKKRNGSEYTTNFLTYGQNKTGLLLADSYSMDIPYISPTQIQMRYKLQVDTLVVDCEGCFDPILREFPQILDNVNLVLLEADYGIGWQRQGFANYSWVKSTIQSKGFHLVYQKVAQNKPWSRGGYIEYWIFKRNR